MKTLAGLTLVLSSLAQMNVAIANISTDTSKSNQINKKFVQQQIQKNASIGRAVKSIISHYPQNAASIVGTALDLYPEKYQEIIHSAISAQPTLAHEVVTIAIDKGISSCSEIVEIAINADPSYVDFVVTAAANSTPEQLKEIVKIAVITEPDSADYIVQSLATAHPNKIVDILQSAIGAVPLVGPFAVEALLALFPNDEEQVITTAVKESSYSKGHVRSIIETAQNSGVNPEALEKYAKSAGITNEEYAELMIVKD